MRLTPPTFLASAFLALSLIFVAQPVEARPLTSKTNKAVGKQQKAKAGKTARSVRSKRALNFGTPQTLMAEPQPTEAGESGLRGVASFYGHGFQGRKVANGERFDVKKMTAASNRFALGTWLAVHRLDSDLCVVVRVNDRMHAKHRVRIIDLSRGAAERLRMVSAGLVLVRAVPLPGPPKDGDAMACRNAMTSIRAVPEVAPIESVKPPEPEIPVLPPFWPLEKGQYETLVVPEEAPIPFAP